MTEREKFEPWWEEWFGDKPLSGWESLRCDNGYAAEEIDNMWDAWQAASASTHEQVAALAAENLCLREQVMCWARECDRIDYRHTNKITDAHQKECEEDLKDIQTPATDAFISEQQAIGVERAMDSMQTSGCVSFGECYTHLANITAQLRDEVKS